MTSSSSRRSLLSGAGLVLLAVLFVALNVLAGAGLGSARLDLTQERLFTLSDGTRAVLKGIREPVTLRFYYSERLGREVPTYGVFATRVREMLQEYATEAGGRIRLQIIDPLPFSDDEDRAVGYGLQGVPLNQAGELVYFGLAGVNAADKEESVAFFQPERERFLEYDLTRLVYNLADPKKKVVGVLSTLPLEGEFRNPRQPPQPWVVYQQLQQFFEIKAIQADAAEIPADVTVLMIVHPRGLADKTLYAIDQFVLRGGRALVFVDPHAEGEMGRPGPAAQTGDTASDLGRLFDAWGVELVKGKFVADRANARRVSAGPETRVRAIDYVAWLQLHDDSFRHDDILTAELKAINLASAGTLKAKEGSTTTLTPLFQSSPQSQLEDVDKIKLAPDPASLLASFKPANERYVLAARIRGAVKSAFPDGPPAAEKKEGAPEPPAAPAVPPAESLKESKVPVNLIVVADSDLLENRFWVTVQDFFGQQVAVPAAANGDFVVNAVDNLSGSDALIGLRGRGVSARPFTRMTEIQRDAEQRFRAKEQELSEKLRATERKLNELRTTKDQAAGKAILTPEQQAEIDRFRGEMLTIRKQLRDVQLDLRRDIDSLQSWVRFLAIGGVPILIVVFALWRGRRRGRRADAAEAPGADSGAAASGAAA